MIASVKSQGVVEAHQRKKEVSFSKNGLCGLVGSVWAEGPCTMRDPQDF